ncbi:hypothetical protein FBALC1_00967 [Flavobacteriales bacterium ALC-1]|nr:hypothetical protein FBALC1_00967 [Flavobacteriales bacterium ALC-1]
MILTLISVTFIAYRNWFAKIKEVENTIEEFSDN